MRVAVHAVGRMKSGPEKELADRFFDRFGKSGAPLGLDFAGVTEISESRAATASERRREEAMRLSAALPTGAALVLLDERGRDLGSEAFARFLAEQRDGGRRATWLAIGGPDGHDRDAAPKADLVLCFGKATWPHQLVRVMLAEQLYRAATILAGHPYHRA